MICYMSYIKFYTRIIKHNITEIAVTFMVWNTKKQFQLHYQEIIILNGTFYKCLPKRFVTIWNFGWTMMWTQIAHMNRWFSSIFTFDRYIYIVLSISYWLLELTVAKSSSAYIFWPCWQSTGKFFLTKNRCNVYRSYNLVNFDP